MNKLIKLKMKKDKKLGLRDNLQKEVDSRLRGNDKKRRMTINV